MPLSAKPYLREIVLDRAQVKDWSRYPFQLPVISQLTTLSFHADVTFFIGENGSGKSTLLEAIAVLLNYNPEGGNRNTRFSSRDTQSILYTALKPVRSFAYPRDAYFLRAESFYNVASYVDDLNDPMAIRSYGGQSLHQQSHGESFLAVLNHKLRGRGLYLLDEPEAALSPARQLLALTAIHQLVQKQSQFIIATHSPILLAYAQAMIYQFSEHGIQPIEYQDTEHYQLTRAFLNNPDRMLQRLLDDTA